MDDDLLALEAELKALQPAAPSRALQARVARDLTPVSRPLPWWMWSIVPAAAALIIAFTLVERRGGPGSNSDVGRATSFRPVAAENVLYAAKDEGPVTLDDGTLARRVRSSYVDTITWQNPSGNASLKWSVPREEVRIVPVRFQ